jgi:cytochrome c-type biogenesis protein CcsB
MKVLRFLLTPAVMGVLFILLAAAMAAATFIENDFGADTARSMVYNTRWFELLFLLLVINLAGQIIIYKLYRREKITVMVFHLAFIVMIIGAAITRYTGFDGMMHIREGEATSVSYSSGSDIVFELADKDNNVLASHSKALSVSGSGRARYRKSLMTAGREVKLKLERYIPGAEKQVEESPDGVPMVAFLATRDMRTSEIIVLAQGETTMAGEMTMGFGTDADITLITDSSSFFIRSGKEIALTRMTDMTRATYPPDTLIRIVPGTVFTIGEYRLIPRQMTLSGVAVPAPPSENTGQAGSGALELTLSSEDFVKKIYLWNNPETERSEWHGTAGDLKVNVSYGNRILKLPFSLSLDDFLIERYPGSNSPSGFKSRVTLTDENHKAVIKYDIYMNHILKYKGYRFYQSSYDKDEHGTVLSVNHDPAGMITTYTGYALLFLFIVLSIINRRSFFRTVKKGYWNSRYRRPAAIVVILLALTSLSPLKAQNLVLDSDEANRFGEVLAQDQKGRTKPLYTISSDILRKVAREKDLDGLSPMQVFMGYSLDPYHWQNVPLIKISNAELAGLLNVEGDKAAFSDLVTFGDDGGYKLSSYVEKAYSRPASERTRFDKEVIKVDERVNICYMMSQGGFLNIFPLKDGTDHWGTSADAARHTTGADDSLFVLSVIPMWAQAVTAVGSAQVKPEEYLSAIKEYQRVHSEYDLPSQSRVRAELLYYRAGIFEKLFPFYATLGLLMIIALISFIITGKGGGSIFMKILFSLAVAGFIFHTLGLGVRWYISGHSPMSNGYESMLFISWVTMLAGFIFSRKSLLALAATSVLSGMTLMVAHLSFMDPEITNLVPVLKSYWLTLHVSVITGSYGFLGLGAILGLIVMIMMLFVSKKNQERISATVDELTVINYRTLTLGLYFLTIGTFLGAVWANESWGRYWGWDPKETWSLITIVIYTLVTHSRMIPGLKNVYAFNLLSLFAFSSVLMTYFGVNYYLSGLHSYAGGDAVPVPVFVYVAVILLVALALAANFMYKRTISRNS